MLKPFDDRDTKGRRDLECSKYLIDKLPLFSRDFEAISASKSLRRLAGKTQVLKAPKDPHVRTRRIHTDEVRQVAKVISLNLGLNTSLCEAIALGHDIGHTPYGHLGEEVISGLSGKEFRHNVFSVVVAQEIERSGRGLNLSYETLEGILLHSRGKGEMTTSNNLSEYDVVMYADKIAYTFADINDAIRYGLLDEGKLSTGIRELGKSQRERVDKCTRSLVAESRECDEVSFSKGRISQIFNEIKNFMYSEVYLKIDNTIHMKVLETTYNALRNECPEIDPAIGLALLTDWELNVVGQLMLNAEVPKRRDFETFGLFEIIPYIEGKDINYTNPKLDWAKNH